MADELRATGRVYDIQFSSGFHFRYRTAKLGYGFNDRAGRRRYVWIELHDGPGDNRYHYDIIVPQAPNDPAMEVEEAWFVKCRAEGVFIISLAELADKRELFA